MNSSPLRLKNARNWFAAGVEVQQALETLTDGAFKVFMHICLNAERSTGVLHTTQVELARNLKKSHGSIRKYLVEMEKIASNTKRTSSSKTAAPTIRSRGDVF